MSRNPHKRWWKQIVSFYIKENRHEQGAYWSGLLLLYLLINIISNRPIILFGLPYKWYSKQVVLCGTNEILKVFWSLYSQKRFNLLLHSCDTMRVSWLYIVLGKVESVQCVSPQPNNNNQRYFSSCCTRTLATNNILVLLPLPTFICLQTLQFELSDLQKQAGNPPLPQNLILFLQAFPEE